MNKLYCPSCAKPNFYQYDAPKICGFCGKSLNLTQTLGSISNDLEEFNTSLNNPKARVLANITTQNIRKPKVIERDNDYDDAPNITEVPNIQQLELDINLAQASQNKGIKFEDLVKQKPTGFKRDDIKTKKISKKQIIEEFKKEAAGKAEYTDVSSNEE